MGMLEDLQRFFDDHPKRVEQAAKDLAADITKELSKPGHGVPSRPGDPPAMQTGKLQKSIKTKRVSPTIVEVYSEVDYAKVLDFGGKDIKKRPFFYALIEKNLTKIRNAIYNWK
jgi:hypothetical protein